MAEERAALAAALVHMDMAQERAASAVSAGSPIHRTPVLDGATALGAALAAPEAAPMEASFQAAALRSR